MSYRSPAQRKAIAIAIAKKKSSSASTSKKSLYPTKRVIRGRGDYYSDFSKKGADWGSKLGGAVGSVADVVQDISKITGFGDYARVGFAVKQNSMIDMGMDPPEVRNAKDGRFIVRHREYLGDVITGAAGAFNVTSYRINPGLETSFPWLAQVAHAYEQYRIRGMVYQFKSTSADALNSTNTALGSVIMATEYDTYEPDFANKVEMENHQYASSAKQSCSMLHPIECARTQTPITELYVRSGAIPPNSDARLYDWGNFQIATVGQQAANVNIGELWCSYEIEFLKPRINEIGALQQSSFYRQENSAPSVSAPFGTIADLEASTKNTIDLEFALDGEANAVAFPKGTNGSFLIVYMASGIGTPGAVTAPTITAYNDGCVFTSANDPFDSNMVAPDSGKTALRVMRAVICNCIGQSTDGYAPAFQLTGGTYPAGAVNAYLYVTAVVDGMSLASVQPTSSFTKVLDRNEIQNELYATLLKLGLLKDDPRESSALAHKYLTPAQESSADQKKNQPTSAVIIDDHVSSADLSQSTAESIHAIIEKARLRKLASEKK